MIQGDLWFLLLRSDDEKEERQVEKSKEVTKDRGVKEKHLFVGGWLLVGVVWWLVVDCWWFVVGVKVLVGFGRGFQRESRRKIRKKRKVKKRKNRKRKHSFFSNVSSIRQNKKKTRKNQQSDGNRLSKEDSFGFWLLGVLVLRLESRVSYARDTLLTRGSSRFDQYLTSLTSMLHGRILMIVK